MEYHYHRCDHELNGVGSRLREISSGKILTFCAPLCRSLFMRAAADATEYRTTHQQDQIKGSAEVQHMTEWINDQVQNGLDPIEEVEATFRGFTERAIERAGVANGISREALRLVLEL